MTEEIRAEMVASVWKIVVAEGDVVQQGDLIAVVE
jgi:acetyl-CoA carboxylase biotin carboxyl carrier protein